MSWTRAADGLMTSLTRSEVVDLLRFLSELGKPGPFANNPAPLIRRWRTGQESAGLPVYSRVNGELPLTDVKDGRARAEIDITTPGRVKLKLNSVAGLKLLVDGQPMPLTMATILDLQRGPHFLDFVVDPNERTEPLRVELDEVPGSKGRAQVVAGR